MKRIILVVVCIIAIGTLIGGNIYWNQKIDATKQSLNEDLSDSSTTSSTKSNENKKKTVAEIKKEYGAIFNELEAQQTSKVDQLVVQAKADFVSNKGTKTEVVAKYQTVSQQLEAQADQSFNAIYQQLQYDLEKNGHRLNEAQEFQQTYKSKKEDRANRISSEISEF